MAWVQPRTRHHDVGCTCWFATLLQKVFSREWIIYVINLVNKQHFELAAILKRIADNFAGWFYGLSTSWAGKGFFFARYLGFPISPNPKSVDLISLDLVWFQFSPISKALEHCYYASPCIQIAHKKGRLRKQDSFILGHEIPTVINFKTNDFTFLLFLNSSSISLRLNATSSSAVSSLLASSSLSSL